MKNAIPVIIVACTIAIILTIAFVGANAAAPIHQPEVTPLYGLKNNVFAYVWVDPETKCEYVSGSNSTNFTPRLDRDHVQICR